LYRPFETWIPAYAESEKGPINAPPSRPRVHTRVDTRKFKYMLYLTLEPATGRYALANVPGGRPVVDRSGGRK
jgi:hypothetical protein